jgi:diguanylate cyclase
MDVKVFIPLAQNASLLLGLSVIFEGVHWFPLRSRNSKLIVIGIFIALICVTIMAVPYTLQEGVVFDTRSILISVTALIFGPIPTFITAAVAILYRLYLGGIGTVPGIAVILSCALIGLGWRRWLYPQSPRWRWLSVYLMSVSVHIVMLGCMLLLPDPVNVNVIRAITLPVLVVYPITSSLLCLLLIRQQETRRLQEQLKQSEERFRMLFDQAPLGYQSLDSDGNILDVNQQWLDMFGYTREEAAGKAFADFVLPEFTEEYRRGFISFKSVGYIRCELVMLSKDGRRMNIHFEGKSNETVKGGAVQYHCILQDITDQIAARESLRVSEEKYGSYIRNAPDAIVILDEKANIVEVNDAAVKISGFSGAELLTMNVMNLVEQSFMDLGVQLFKELSLRGRTDGELAYRHKNGSIRWAKISAVMLSDSRALCFMSDISEQKSAAEKLIFASTHDDLTGLCNRQFFDIEARRLSVPEQLPLSVIIGDINGLKLINDSFGLAEGDRVIVETAKFIGGFCRPGDVLARTGGDEFSILLPKTDYDAAMNLLNSIHAACGVHNQATTDDLLHIHLALGAAAWDPVNEAFLEVLKRAEQSMNQRKLLEERSSHSSIIATIKATMREKSHETEAHEERIAQLARKVGVILGLTQVDLDNIELLAGLHDIGKVGISEQVLNKPGKLNDTEWQEMRKHPEIGERIAMSTSSLAPIAYYILCHHERWDGSGYPQKLVGYEIPLLSRILSIVDAYDAMTQDRVYQKAITHEDALAEIRKNAGTQFDPQLAQIFCEEVFRKAG